MEDSDLEELYQDLIVDHYKNPRCRGACDNPSSSSQVYNPLCGDTIDLNLEIHKGVIKCLRFSGKGCSISQALASIMCEACKGKTVSEVKLLRGVFEKMIEEGDVSEEDSRLLGDLLAFKGIKKFPARHRCALLAWQALGDSLDNLNA